MSDSGKFQGVRAARRGERSHAHKSAQHLPYRPPSCPPHGTRCPATLTGAKQPLCCHEGALEQLLLLLTRHHAQRRPHCQEAAAGVGGGQHVTARPPRLLRKPGKRGHTAGTKRAPACGLQGAGEERWAGGRAAGPADGRGIMQTVAPAVHAAASWARVSQATHPLSNSAHASASGLPLSRVIRRVTSARAPSISRCHLQSSTGQLLSGAAAR